MTPNRWAFIGLVCLATSASLACTRASESSTSRAGTGSSVDDDVRGVAKATEKTATDVGHATADLGEKAKQGLVDATNKAGANGQDAWITAKVKSQLVSDGFDPLAVHVDTDRGAVTLSGTVDSATDAQKAVRAARAVTGVSAVADHLFVKPAER